MEDILREVAVNEGFSKQAQVEIFSSGLEDGSNFHCSSKRANITEGGRTLSVFIKEEIKCNETNTSQKFSNEIHFYTKIYPQLKAYGSIPKVPRYLWGGAAKDGAVIVLEDLTTEGFEATPVDRVLDAKQVELVLKELEKLHETSKKLRKQNPVLFEELAAGLEEGFCVGHLYEGVLAECFKNALRATDEHLPAIYKTRLENFDFNEAKYWAMKRSGPGIAFTHGDSWHCNFLFKYQGEIASCVAIVDWQLCRVGSPFLDVSELLFTSTSGFPFPRSVPECRFGLSIAITIIPFALGQVDPRLAMTPDKLVFTNNTDVIRRIANIVKVAVDSGII